ncbi:MAG: lysylphosphatidylglycerol synthase transmembrane domain-containing protein [Acidimicrobiales bacterium]
MDKLRKRRWWRAVRGALSLAMIALAIYFLAARVDEIQRAWGLVRNSQLRWLGAAVLFEMASMVVFARLQRGLLRAGGVWLPLRTMVELTVAGNAVAATLPGGVAWAAAWVFGQLSRRGVDRFLRIWVFLVAGAVSSFALFVVVGVGVWLAGNRGPVAGLRWGVLVLAMIPVTALALFPLRCTDPARRAANWIKEKFAAMPGGKQVERATGSLFRRIEAVHLSPAGWAEVLGLALLNWLYDCAVLIMALLALGIPVPWRGIFVIYGVTQIAAALPITPGGFGVVEGSLAALLHAYGVPTEQSIATVIVYRLISFWGLVPIGWVVWAALDLIQRRSPRRVRPHPWAFHSHFPESADQHTRDMRVLLREPRPCEGCEDNAEGIPAAVGDRRGSRAGGTARNSSGGDTAAQDGEHTPEGGADREDRPQREDSAALAYTERR